MEDIAVSRLLIVLPLLFFPAGNVRGQPLHYTVETLDWMAADSHVVVHGVVVDFVQETDAAKKKWITIVLKVRETLKGRHRPFHTFVCPDDDNYDAPRWKKSEAELLVFLAATKPVGAGNIWWGEKAAAYDLTLRRSYNSLVELSSPVKMGKNLAQHGKIYTTDLQDPSEPKPVLQYTRAAIAAQANAKELRAYHLDWPKGVVTYTRVVPVNELLERQARKWITSDDPKLKAEGARALKLFEP
jgi:hypothetical protein